MKKIIILSMMMLVGTCKTFAAGMGLIAPGYHHYHGNPMAGIPILCLYLGGILGLLFLSTGMKKDALYALITFTIGSAGIITYGFSTGDHSFLQIWVVESVLILLLGGTLGSDQIDIKPA